MNKQDESPRELIRTVSHHVQIKFDVHAGPQMSHYLDQIRQRRIVGRRSKEGKVYVPPLSACPTTGEEMGEEVQVSDHGTITTFCIVNIPFEGQKIDPPYILAAILLDGADLPIFHLLGDCDVHSVDMGTRVKAVWRPEAEAVRSMENIQFFVPSGEPEADYESYKEHI